MIEMTVCVSSNAIDVCSEVTVRGLNYSPDVINDVRRRAVDAFRDAVAIITDFDLLDDDDEEEEILIDDTVVQAKDTDL
jgi:hypothetical protein